MKILNIQNYPGRNIYCYRPVLKAVLDLEELYDTPTSAIEGFNGKLMQFLPGIARHYCSTGVEGGFTERLREGTYPAHVTEHMALELQATAGYQVSFGKSRLLKEPSLYTVVFEYVNEKCAVECLIAAVDIFNRLASDQTPDMAGILGNIRKVAEETDLGPSTRAIYDEARKRGIPVTRMGTGSILMLGYGKYSRYIEASLTDSPGCLAVDIAGNKQLTKELLSLNGIPVPDGRLAYTPAAAASAAELMGFPVVVKPFDANQGKGVTLDIQKADEVETAWDAASQYSKAVLVENYIQGRDYRLLVVGGRLAAAAERIPPYVTGDGKSTVRELVDMENGDGLRGNDHEKPLTKIKLDDTAGGVLKKSGKSLEYIAAGGERVQLRFNGNLSTGGTARDCTEEVHEYNAGLAVKAAEILGLDIAGVDMITDDISKPIICGGGAIVEVNAAPGLRMHLFPTEGKVRNVAENMLDMLFPSGKPASIPIAAVTGTNGKTTTTRLIGHTLLLMGLVPGLTTTSGVYIGGECISRGDNTGPSGARLVLADKRVEAAVLETARGGIIKRGLGYELADVGVITNISEDHLGIDGINTVEEMCYVKSLVVESVKEGGSAVLNAEDAMTPYFLERIKCRTVLFSSREGNTLFERHVATGGTGICRCGGSIRIYDNGNELEIADLTDIPITFNGYSLCNVENSLAAAAALYALQVPVAVIRKGLLTFMPDEAFNPGRMNLFDLGGIRIMLDYGHNPAGFRAVVDMLPGLDAQRIIGIVGMPGDRNDRSIREAGGIFAHSFHKLYIKEDKDLRGRDPGEVADIFFDAVLTSGMAKEQVEIVYSELEALRAAVADSRAGDLIVVFYEEFEPVLELVRELKAAAAAAEVVMEAAAGNPA